MGLGRLLNSHLGGTLDVFGCPSHVPYTAQQVRAGWDGKSGAFGAFLYRETDTAANPKFDLNPPNLAIALDENNVDTQYRGHSWQWANVLYVDGHGRGYPNAPIFNSRYFTHDHTVVSMDVIWQNADKAP